MMPRESALATKRSQSVVKRHAIAFAVSAVSGCAAGNALTAEVPAAPERSPDASRQVASTTSVRAEGPRCVGGLETVSTAWLDDSGDCPEAPSQLPDLAVTRLRFPDAPGAPELRVEHAENDAERRVGLMYRTALGEDRGMLFSWKDERPRAFWMRNTCIPLDMLFIDREGFIVGILEQVPRLNDEPRRVACPATQVLEVNAGFCRKHGIRPGQRIVVDPAG